MFGKEKISALERELLQKKEELEKVVKEKTDLQRQLDNARAKISELEKQISESELTELKDKAKHTIAEYEGLKEHYIQKAKEIDDTRASVEEEFAREAAVKRYDLAEEIRSNKESNQAMVSKTVQTFTGSYLYYLDQIRVLMDALSQAARETGETLFDGDTENIKERFGSRIADRLQSDANALGRNSGDLLLIGAEEAAAEVAEEAEEIAAEEIPEAEEEEEISAEEPAEPEEAEDIPAEEPAEAEETGGEETGAADSAEEIPAETEKAAEETIGTAEEEESRT